MKLSDALLDTLDVLVRQGGWPEAEVFHKKGRSRTLHHSLRGQVSCLRQEEGWSVRAGDPRRSFFYAASGSPSSETAWPEADGRGLRLPSPKPVPSWKAPSDLDASLVGENEARGIFEALARELDRELPGARLIQGHLEDGSSELQLASSREVRCVVRQRTASLHLEASGPRRGAPSVSLLLAEREARRFSPPALARRLADRLLILDRGNAVARDRGEFLLGPGLMAMLIDALRGLWMGPEASARAAGLGGREGRFASRSFSLVDDGRLAGGVFEAPVDGEGQPTRETVLVEQGLYRQPLVSWRQATPAVRPSGCCRRPGWRDLPRPGPSHLYLRPDSAVSVASLLASLPRGYYLLGSDGGVRVDPEFRRFAVPVSGFAIDAGRPVGTVTGAWLVGGVPALLNGLVARARDLTFLPVGGALVGAPTVLVRGLELRQAP